MFHPRRSFPAARCAIARVLCVAARHRDASRVAMLDRKRFRATLCPSHDRRHSLLERQFPLAARYRKDHIAEDSCRYSSGLPLSATPFPAPIVLNAHEHASALLCCNFFTRTDGPSCRSPRAEFVLDSPHEANGTCTHHGIYPFLRRLRRRRQHAGHCRRRRWHRWHRWERRWQRRRLRYRWQLRYGRRLRHRWHDW